MRFFFDRCAPIGLAKMVRAIDGKTIQIVHHDEDSRFHEKTTDIEWMTLLGNDGAPPWIVISGDGRILKNKVERKVLDETGLPFFCLDDQWVMWPIAWRFMRAWPNIVAQAKNSKNKRFRVRAGSSLKIESI